MDRVVAPVDQRYPDAVEEVRVTWDPGQISFGPLLEIVGVAGAGFTVAV